MYAQWRKLTFPSHTSTEAVRDQNPTVSATMDARNPAWTIHIHAGWWT
jgi:hypothetical protein